MNEHTVYDEQSFNHAAEQEHTLPLVILGEMVVIMPRIPVPLQVGKGKSYRAMEEAMEGEREVLLIFVSDQEIEGYKGNTPQKLPPYGVIARLEEFLKLQDDTVRIILEGIERAEILECVQSEPYYKVRCRPHPDPEVTGTHVEALVAEVK